MAQHKTKYTKYTLALALYFIVTFVAWCYSSNKYS